MICRCNSTNLAVHAAGEYPVQLHDLRRNTGIIARGFGSSIACGSRGTSRDGWGGGVARGNVAGVSGEDTLAMWYIHLLTESVWNVVDLTDVNNVTITWQWPRLCNTRDVDTHIRVVPLEVIRLIQQGVCFDMPLVVTSDLLE